MNYLIIITVGAAGILLGQYFGRRRKKRLIFEQTKIKRENKEKILRFFQKNREAANNDIEKLLGVSDATAERYLDELEKEGEITQRGKTGQGVFYTINPAEIPEKK